MRVLRHIECIMMENGHFHITTAEVTSKLQEVTINNNINKDTPEGHYKLCDHTVIKTAWT